MWVDNREMLLLSSNDYLGLTDDPRVLAAAEDALRRWGSSTTGARMANGSRAYHGRLEERLAAFLGREACHVSSAGYLSCVSAVATFAQRGDRIYVDRNVHSSLWSGIQLSGAAVERFRHNDPEDLAESVRADGGRSAGMLVTEGVFSMEGHVAPLADLAERVREHGLFWVLDDAHGIGVMGPEGRGTAASAKVCGDVDLLCGSLSKSLSSTGGFVAGDRGLIEFLRTHSKQMIFSAAISAPQAAAAEAVVGILETDPSPRERLWSNTRLLHDGLRAAGVDFWESTTPATPIVAGSRERAYLWWRTLWDQGFFTVMALSPAVPPGRDLLRVAVSARHQPADLSRFVDAVAKLSKRH